jgi:hypothetical protein
VKAASGDADAAFFILPLEGEGGAPVAAGDWEDGVFAGPGSHAAAAARQRSVPDSIAF